MTPSTAAAPARTEPWMTLPLALSPRAERLTGADSAPMLYLAGEDRYLRLSAGAAGLVDALDGTLTAADILDALTAGDPALADRRRGAALAALQGLRACGALSVPPPETEPTARPRRRLPRHPRVRIPGGIDATVAAPAALAVRHPRTVKAFLLLVAAVSLALLVMSLVTFPGAVQVSWTVLVAVLLGEVVFHELAHAAACRAYGVRIREAGLMLWFWFLPLAYVDCTDVYRLRDRGPRVWVALVGPLVDLTFAGAAAAVTLTSSGVTQGTAAVLVASFILVLARNLTPLLPSDGTMVLEALTGELNLRGRAWTHLRAQRLPRTRRERLYAGYGVASLLYGVLMMAFLLVPLQLLTSLAG
jgi:putative peptide zinc metalloprotease protein